MRKMSVGKIIVIVVALFAVTGGLQAQDKDNTLPIPALFAQQGDYVTFYGLDDHNTLVEMGHLPERFYLEWNQNSSQNEQTLALRNWWNMNLVLSPDGSTIAVTADYHFPDQSGINFYLFLYDPQSGDLQQAYTTLWTGGPRTDVRWSPDSHAILIDPTYGESPSDIPPVAQPFVYLLDTGGVMLENDLYSDMNWGEDSTTLREIGLVLANPYDNTRHTIRQIGNQSSPASDQSDQPDWPCNYRWSAGLERWYSVFSCNEDSDHYLSAIYSTALNGNRRLEVDLKDYLAEQFELTEDVSSALEIHKNDLFADDGNIYATLLFSYPSDTGKYDRYYETRVIQISDKSQIKPVFINNSTDPNPFFRYAFPSPDYHYFAFVSGVQVSSQVFIGDTIHNTMVGHVILKGIGSSGFEWRYWMGRWIDSQRFIYEDSQDVWLFDASDQTFTNLTANMEQTAWLLPQTNSN